MHQHTHTFETRHCCTHIQVICHWHKMNVTPNMYNISQLTDLTKFPNFRFGEVVALLLQHDADPNSKSDRGTTPLHEAAKAGRYLQSSSHHETCILSNRYAVRSCFNRCCSFHGGREIARQPGRHCNKSSGAFTSHSSSEVASGSLYWNACCVLRGIDVSGGFS